MEVSLVRAVGGAHGLRNNLPELSRYCPDERHDGVLGRDLTYLKVGIRWCWLLEKQWRSRTREWSKFEHAGVTRKENTDGKLPRPLRIRLFNDDLGPH